MYRKCCDMCIPTLKDDRLWHCHPLIFVFGFKFLHFVDKYSCLRFLNLDSTLCSDTRTMLIASLIHKVFSLLFVGEPGPPGTPGSDGKFKYFRGIFRNLQRVGVIPVNVTLRHILLPFFLSFYSRRVHKPLKGALSAVFCTELCLIHLVRLLWWHTIPIFLS